MILFVVQAEVFAYFQFAVYLVLRFEKIYLQNKKLVILPNANNVFDIQRRYLSHVFLS